ncbi:serine/threonine protein phosphatase (plasmid) [Rhizobium sp. WL3]|uniref:metallophosphoesterase family protein n=1 Tax=Rhizobium sp. WL3 TaxID=2603277 RepID=UPI0011C207A3|nr:metallophosphoesterase family protein [Rhizobium sp. WL3]QEE43362.1 serine/threonine protein phosphatase [Rhizobium sp. WL3]
MLTFLKGLVRNPRSASPSISLPRQRISLEAVQLNRTVYAIGDVHGRIDLLLDAERRILQDLQNEQRQPLVVLLGDYVDRGPYSAAVLDHLALPSPPDFERILLCGNHDAAFAAFIEDAENNLGWIEFGGRQTLMSYGIEPDKFIDRGRNGIRELAEIMSMAIPAAHRKLLSELPVYLKIGSLLLVHAGIRPGLPLESQRDEDLMWIREPFLSKGPEVPLFVVHGHTPAKDIQVGPRRIGIDTAALSTGHLTVLKIKDRRFSLV